MKKAYIATAIMAASMMAMAGGVFADENTQAQPSAEQIQCMREARETQMKAVRDAMQKFNEATKDAMKAKQDAIKDATDTFNEATKNALKKKQDAIAASAKMADPKKRAEAMMAANDAFNKSKEVAAARPVYTEAIKAANDAFNNDEAVKAARAPYDEAMKGLRENFSEKCNAVAKAKPKADGVWNSLQTGIDTMTAGLVNGILRLFHLK